MNLSAMLKGISGEFELTRVAGAFGTAIFVLSAAGYEAFDVMWKGRPFDVTAYCLAFPAGLTACVAAIAGAASWKDKGVATAAVIRETGAAPGLAPGSAAPAPP